MSNDTFDLIVSRNDANECVVLTHDNQLKPYISVDGKRYALDDLLALLPLADAVLDHADKHCRAFPIATAPTGRDVSFWDSSLDEWQEFTMLDISLLPPSYTHWREPFPPPSNPPLPAVFMELGAALEKLKSQP